MRTDDIEHLHFSTIDAWRSWLQDNHARKKAVWMICYKKGSANYSFSWSEAVDQALCFGWIDSLKKSRGDGSSIQFFSKRKPLSTWSKINKDKVEHLITTGQMTEAGFASIALAKANGSWSILDDVEALIVPEDLKQALQTEPTAASFFHALSKSNKKMVLQWIVLARQETTRANRIAEIVRCAALGTKPKALQ